jgi:hypothetical protein
MNDATKDPYTRSPDSTDSDNSAQMYARTYLWMRAIVAFLGIGLPLMFIVGEYFYLRGGVHFRGSISAYYHTSMHDVFVAGLCVIGFLLITYMVGQPTTADFWVSLAAGIAVIVVAFFPTARPGLTGADARCGTQPAPAGCAPIQQRFGEALTAQIHFAFAVTFIVCLAVAAFLFARRERRWDHGRRAAVQIGCGVCILAAIVGVAVGEYFDLSLGELTPLYVGEVVSVWAFGASWLLTLRGLLSRLTRRGQAGVGEPALSTG